MAVVVTMQSEWTRFRSTVLSTVADPAASAVQNVFLAGGSSMFKILSEAYLDGRLEAELNRVARELVATGLAIEKAP